MHTRVHAAGENQLTPVGNKKHEWAISASREERTRQLELVAHVLAISSVPAARVERRRDGVDDRA
jgi:hypothetical protein